MEANEDTDTSQASKKQAHIQLNQLIDVEVHIHFFSKNKKK